MGGTPSSDRIIEDVDRSLEALLIVFCRNSASVEGLVYRNGHRRKETGERKSVSWGGSQTKGEICECKLTKNMFLHSDLLQLYLKKKWKITEFFPVATVFFIKKSALRTNEIKI